MSDFVALGGMVAVAIANAFLTLSLNKWVNGTADVIAGGGLEGVQLSHKHRRYLLQVRSVTNLGALIAIHGVLAIGWFLTGSNASSDDLRLLAYLIAFLNSVGAIGWLATSITNRRHLASLLREAEAD
jgi:hypothetical protein